MIHKIAWGLALIFIGLSMAEITFGMGVLLTVAGGVALVVAGAAYIAGK